MHLDLSLCALDVAGADLLKTGALNSMGVRALEDDIRRELGKYVTLPESFVTAHPAVHRLAAYALQQLLYTAVGTMMQPHTLLKRYLDQQVGTEQHGPDPE